ncbi:hypothetical protein HDU76_007879 [Blyttiomyces sp. JEL0837]|nr:hypothetical protein HDU76_007879 [Blyttiomyces sp. JEL0837]
MGSGIGGSTISAKVHNAIPLIRNTKAGRVILVGGLLAFVLILMILQVLPLAHLPNAYSSNNNNVNDQYNYQPPSALHHDHGVGGNSNAISPFDSAADSQTCDKQFVFDEVKFDYVPSGDKWHEYYFEQAKKDVASQSSPMYCDLSRLELPMHITQVTSGDVKYKVALHPPPDIVSELGVPFESGYHIIFRALLRVAAAHTGNSEKDKLLVLDVLTNKYETYHTSPQTLAQFLGALNHEVHTFEPFAKNMNLLRCSQLVNKFDNIFLQRVALSNETSNSKKCINLPPGNVGGSTLSDECFNDGVYTTNSMDIRTIQLDDYWNIVLNKRRPDYITRMQSFGYSVYGAGSLKPYDTVNYPNDDIIFVHKDIVPSPLANLNKMLSLSIVNGVSITLKLGVLEDAPMQLTCQGARE